MNWNNPDAYPGESEEEYIARKDEESQASTGLMFTLFGMFFSLLKTSAVFGVFLYAGFLLSQKLLGADAEKLKLWGFALLFTYFIFCIVYFLKGTVIGLRAGKRKLWLLPWVICVLLCCIVPAFIVKSAVSGMFFNLVERQGVWYNGVTWGAFILFSMYTYGIYRFLTPTAPRILYWSYAWGLKVSL